jgi:multiple sugar transport system substrate-binding protein
LPLWRHVWRVRFAMWILATSLGCSPHPSGNEAPTLVFKHPRLLSREEPLRLLLDEFRRSHPDIRVREEVLPSSSDQQHLFYVTNLEAGANDFDVFALDIIWVPEFRRAQWLLDVTAQLTLADVSDFLPASLAPARFNERIYAIPWFADAGVLYYRKDLLERYGFSPPRTVAELVSTAQSILRQEQNPTLSGFVWQGKQYEGLLCVALEFIRASGGEIMDSRGRSQLTTPQTLAGLRNLRHTVSEFNISPRLTKRPHVTCLPAVMLSLCAIGRMPGHSCKRQIRHCKAALA